MASGRPWRKGRRTVTLSGAGVSVVILALSAAGISMANPQPTLAEVQKQVDALDHEVEVATERYNRAKGQLTAVQRRVAAAQANVDRQQARVTELIKDIGGFAAASYRTGSMDPLIQVFLAADHNEFLAQAAVADAYASQQVGALHIVAIERQRLAEERAVASEVLERLKLIERDLSRYKTSIEGKLAKAQQLLSTLRAEERAIVDRGRITTGLPAATLPQTAATVSPATLSTMLPPTSSPPAGWISVESHGARPNDSGDDTTALHAAFGAAASTGMGIMLPAGSFHVNGTLDIPNALTHIQMSPQTVLRQYGDPKFGTLSKRGSIGASYSVSPAARNATTINFTNTSGISVGTWLVLQSDDSFSGTKPMQPGRKYQRQQGHHRPPVEPRVDLCAEGACGKPRRTCHDHRRHCGAQQQAGQLLPRGLAALRGEPGGEDGDPQSRLRRREPQRNCQWPLRSSCSRPGGRRTR
jgi:hypothetical protein